MIASAHRFRVIVVALALMLAVGYFLYAALEPRAATAAGVFILALEGAAFLLLHVCRRRR